MKLGRIGRDAFHGFYLGAVRLNGKEQTGANDIAVKQNSAGAADALLATDVGTGESEIVAQKIREKLPRFHLPGVFTAVDCQPYRPGAHCVLPFICSVAR
jgi:hypothetical protein